ncbi:MAG: hypothetical protein ACLTZY_08180 [Alistipes indistinctus]
MNLPLSMALIVWQADADLFGQLLLGEADDGPLDTDVISSWCRLRFSL